MHQGLPLAILSPMQRILRSSSYVAKSECELGEAGNPHRPTTPGLQDRQVVALFRKMKRKTAGTLIARLERPVRIERAPRIPKAGK